MHFILVPHQPQANTIMAPQRENNKHQASANDEQVNEQPTASAAASVGDTTSTSNDNSSGGGHEDGENETNYWPLIDDWLSTREGPKPAVRCIICLRRLAISDLQEPNDHGDGEDMDLEPLTLPCGHVFGDECVTRWILIRLVSWDDSRGPSCPTCRAPIYPDSITEYAARLQALLVVDQAFRDSLNNRDQPERAPEA